MASSSVAVNLDSRRIFGAASVARRSSRRPRGSAPSAGVERALTQQNPRDDRPASDPRASVSRRSRDDTCRALIAARSRTSPARACRSGMRDRRRDRTGVVCIRRPQATISRALLERRTLGPGRPRRSRRIAIAVGQTPEITARRVFDGKQRRLHQVRGSVPCSPRSSRTTSRMSPP